MAESGPRTVSVSVVLPRPVPAGGTVRVRVEDTSRADAAAAVIAHLVERLSGPLTAGTQRTFTLAVPDVDDRARYNVRVHVDISGSGEMSAGDLVTTRAYPVLTHGAPDHVDVEVVPI
jgi:putative lipoprotein